MRPLLTKDQSILLTNQPDLTLRNLYAGQEATVRTGHWKPGWFQIRKGERQGCILSPCLFNLYAEYIMWNTMLDKTQAAIKITGRNIHHLRYGDNTTLMAESKELKSLLMKVKRRVRKMVENSTFGCLLWPPDAKNLLPEINRDSGKD